MVGGTLYPDRRVARDVGMVLGGESISREPQGLGETVSRDPRIGCGSHDVAVCAPQPFDGVGTQMRSARIERHIARRRHQMLLVERDRAEPALKQMAGLARAGVDEAGVEPAPRDSASPKPSPSCGVRMR